MDARKRVWAAAGAVAVVGLLAVGVARAANGTPQKQKLNLTTGATSWTVPYGAFALDSVELYATDPVNATGTVKVVQDGQTNTLTSALVVASGYGRFAPTNTTYLFGGAQLYITGGGTNTGTARIIGVSTP